MNNKDYSEKAGIIKRKYLLENIDSEDITRKEKKFELLLIMVVRDMFEHFFLTNEIFH